MKKTYLMPITTLHNVKVSANIAAGSIDIDKSEADTGGGAGGDALGKEVGGDEIW